MTDEERVAANRLALAGELFPGLRHDVNNSCSVVMNNMAFTTSVVKGLGEEVAALEALARSGSDRAELGLAIQRLRDQVAEDGQEMQDCFGECMDAARRVVQLNNTMLQLPRTGRPLGDSLVQLLAAAIDTANLWQRKSVLITADPVDSWMPADPDALYQLLVNLLVNARQSFARAEPGNRIHVSQRGDRLVVESNGSPHTNVRLERPGLGLYTARQLAVGLGLELEVDIREDGATVTLGPLAP